MGKSLKNKEIKNKMSGLERFKVENTSQFNDIRHFIGLRSALRLTMTITSVDLGMST